MWDYFESKLRRLIHLMTISKKETVSKILIYVKMSQKYSIWTEKFASVHTLFFKNPQYFETQFNFESKNNSITKDHPNELAQKK